jgi:hypothetical protein
VQRSSWWTSRNSLPSLSRLSCSLRDLCPQSKHTLDVFLSGVEIVGTRLWMRLRSPMPGVPKSTALRCIDFGFTRVFPLDGPRPTSPLCLLDCTRPPQQPFVRQDFSRPLKGPSRGLGFGARINSNAVRFRRYLPKVKALTHAHYLR